MQKNAVHNYHKINLFAEFGESIDEKVMTIIAKLGNSDLVGKGHIKVKVMSKLSNMSNISVVLSKYELKGHGHINITPRVGLVITWFVQILIKPINKLESYI